MQYSVVIPTLNAGKTLGRLLDALMCQTVQPAEILVVDSASEDDTVRQTHCCDRVRLFSIRREEFDHGGTRDKMLRACRSPFVVMMTQDALPENSSSMENLLKPFDDPQVAAVCARQIAYPQAKEAEKAIRAFRYSDESDVWDQGDMGRRGIKAYLLSNVCTAYRVSAYKAVGGFESPIIMDEDMLIAADFLRMGYKLAYQAEARVWHSHDYSLRQEYERYKKIGMFLGRYGNRFDESGETSEGLAMARYVTARLLKKCVFGELLPFWCGCAAKLFAIGRGKKRRTERTNDASIFETANHDP